MGGPRWDRVRRYPFAVTLLVLSRGDRLFRAEFLRGLQERALGEILWVEGSDPSTDIESLAHDFPDVRFLLMKTPGSIGERINVGIAESRSPCVFVLWSDTRLSDFSASVITRLEESKVICSVPVARNAQAEPIPSWQSPQWKKRKLSLLFRVPRSSGESTLFPYDYCGLYNREKFSQSGGYDPLIANPYWQKLDFGFRCFLWGERLQGTKDIVLTYTGAPPQEDTTPDEGYKTFWLKNLAVRRRREMGVLPVSSALEYMTHSDTGPLYAINEFRAVRAWVHTHRFRFRREPRDVIENWEIV
jgi:hypothetical protein